jgi:hypothetical protein
MRPALLGCCAGRGIYMKGVGFLQLRLYARREPLQQIICPNAHYTRPG